MNPVEAYRRQLALSRLRPQTPVPLTRSGEPVNANAALCAEAKRRLQAIAEGRTIEDTVSVSSAIEADREANGFADPGQGELPELLGPELKRRRKKKRLIEKE